MDSKLTRFITFPPVAEYRPCERPRRRATKPRTRRKHDATRAFEFTANLGPAVPSGYATQPRIGEETGYPERATAANCQHELGASSGNPRRGRNELRLKLELASNIWCMPTVD